MAVFVHLKQSKSGSLSLPTLLSEAAFYRFYFWYGMATPPPTPFVTRHTVFEAAYRSRRGLKLQDPPFDAFQQALTHPADYSATQRLGTQLREAGVEAFEYRSARSEGINVALFTSRALADARPRSQEHWLCETDGEHVRCLGETQIQVHVLALERFLVDGGLPMPTAWREDHFSHRGHRGDRENGSSMQMHVVGHQHRSMKNHPTSGDRYFSVGLPLEQPFGAGIEALSSKKPAVLRSLPDLSCCYCGPTTLWPRYGSEMTRLQISHSFLFLTYRF